jgi:type IV pilus assembly protein PilB
MESRARLGELLVDAGIITAAQLERGLALQRSDGRRLGAILVEAGVISETEVTQVLSRQLSVPWVSLYHVDFSRQLLNLVPRSLAEMYCLVPIFLRRVRGHGDTLYVAMDDPTDERALEAVSVYAGLPVRAMIAPPGDIRAAIRVYYGPASEAAPSTVPPPDDVVHLSPSSLEDLRSGPPIGDDDGPVTLPPGEPSIHSEPGLPTPPPLSTAATPVPLSAPTPIAMPPPMSPRDSSIPAPRRGAKPRMVKVTLLDGTEICLPARREDAAEETSGDMTARDVVAALGVVTQGNPQAELFGETLRWEPLVASLLSLLLKKHLLADWEFVEEYRKHAHP